MTTAAPFPALTPDAPGVVRRAHLSADWRRPAVAGGHDIYWSAAEGFGQILPRPSPAEAAAFYQVAYYTHTADQDGAAQRGGLFWRILMHLAWRRDAGVEADRQWWATTLGSASLDCLEIGCGAGQTLDLLCGLGHRVCGVEPDPDARRVAQERGLEVLDGTAEDLPAAITARRHDVVVLFHVLEHCIDPVLALRNVQGLLKDGGIVLIEVPNNACRGAALFGTAWAWLDVPRHLNFFTPRSLERIVSAGGLVSEGLEYSGYTRQFSTGWAAMQRQIAAVVADPRGRQTWRYPLLLALTAFAGSAAKYDSVRIRARRHPAVAPAPSTLVTPPARVAR